MSNEILVNELASQLEQSRLLDINIKRADNYDRSVMSFDKAPVNAGADLIYNDKTTNRISIQLASLGHSTDLTQLSIAFRYKPKPRNETNTADDYSKGLIFPSDVTQIFEGESLKFGATQVASGSSHYDMFNAFTHTLNRSKQERDMMAGTLGSSTRDFYYNQTELDGLNGEITARTRDKRLYQTAQQKWLQKVDQHYKLSTVAPTSYSASEEERLLGRYYEVRIADIFPQIDTMGEIAKQFPLPAIQQISFKMRLVPCGHSHICATVAYGSTEASHKKNQYDSYELSDVVLIRHDQPYTQSGKLMAERALSAGLYKDKFVDFEFDHCPVTSNGSFAKNITCVLKDLRFLLCVFTLREELWDEFEVMTATQDIHKNDKCYPYIAPNRHFFAPKMIDQYYTVNGMNRWPSSEPQLLPDADIQSIYARAVMRELYGRDVQLSLDQYEQHFGGRFIIFPFQREAFGNNIDLSGQSSQITINFKFADQSKQPSSGLVATNLQLHVFKVFDREIQILPQQVIVR